MANIKRVNAVRAEASPVIEDPTPGPKFNLVIVIGAGGAGYWTSVALARMIGERPIGVAVFDDDTFQGGLGALRLPYSMDATTKKVEHLWGFVKMAMGDDPPTTNTYRLTGDESHLFTPGTLVVDCTDMDRDPRTEMWGKIEAGGAQIMRVSYDGNKCVVSHGLPLIMKEKGGYLNVPDMAATFVAAGLGAKAIMRTLDGIEWESREVEI